MEQEEEVLAKIKNLQKKQICYIALRTLRTAMPIAYTQDTVGRMPRDMALKEKLQEVGQEILKLSDEIGKPTLMKYFEDKDWCQSHKFTIAEQREATKECFGEEWDMDKLIAFAEEHQI